MAKEQPDHASTNHLTRAAAGSSRTRPPSVTAIGWLFIVAGTVGVTYHAKEFRIPPSAEVLWVLLVRLLAIVCGLFVLRGANWARWLALAWVAYHVGLSALHSVSETAVHAALLAVVAFVLLRPRASAFFRAHQS